MRNWEKYHSIILVIALALVASLLMYEGLGKSDTNEFTVILYKMLDSNYLSNDWFVSINAEGIGIRSYFIGLLWGTLQIIPHVGFVYFFWYFVTLAILALSVYLISNHLFKDEKAAIFTSFLVLIGATFQLGGNLMVHSYLVSFGLSFALTVLSLYFLLSERPYLFALIAGLATLVHFLWGGIGFGILWATSFLIGIRDKTIIKKHLLTALIYLPFFLLITPVLIGQANAATNLSNEQVAEMLGYIRAPHHYLPFTWDLIHYIEFFMFLSIAFIALLKSRLNEQCKRFFLLLGGLILASFLVYTFFSEIVPFGLIIKMHFFRLAPLLCLIGYLFIGHYLFQTLRDSARHDVYKSLFALTLTISLLSNHLILISWIFFMGLFFYGDRLRIKRIAPALIGAGLVLAITLGAIYSSTLFMILSAKSDRILLFLYKIVLLVPLLFYLLSDEKKTKLLFYVAITLLAVLFIAVKPTFFYYAYPSATEDMYGFIRTSTPPDAIFLIPPSEGSFRLGANRAIVIDFKAFPFEEKHMLTWVERIQDVSNHPPIDKSKTYSDLVEQGYASLTEQNVLELRKKYGFSYALFKGDKDLPFKRAYANEEYVLYEVSQ